MTNYENLAEQFIEEIESDAAFKEEWVKDKDFLIMKNILKSFAEWLDKKSGAKICEHKYVKCGGDKLACGKCGFILPSENELKNKSGAKECLGIIDHCPCFLKKRAKCCYCKKLLEESGARPVEEKKGIEELYGIFTKILIGEKGENFVALTEEGADKLLDKINEMVEKLNQKAKPVETKSVEEKKGIEVPILSVGYHKSEIDFGVNCSIKDLSYEQMKKLREMTIVMIGVAEDMWRRGQENAPSTHQRNNKKTKPANRRLKNEERTNI